MNYQEIVEKLKELEIQPRDIREEIGGWGNLQKGEFIKLFGKTEIVDEEGDCEGGGDYSMKVFHFKDHDVYIKITGFYASYDGTTWNDDYIEVRPKEKTITVYE